MSQADIRTRAQALLAEASELESRVQALHQERAEAQETLAIAEALGAGVLVAAKQAEISQTQEVITMLTEAAEKRKRDAEALLAALVA